MIYDNCTVITMDRGPADHHGRGGRRRGRLDRHGGQVRPGARRLPGRAGARPPRLAAPARARRRARPPAAGDAPRQRRRGAAVDLDGEAHLHPRGQLHPSRRAGLDAPRDRRDDQGGNDCLPRDADPRPPRPLIAGGHDLGDGDPGRAAARRHRRRRLPGRVAASSRPRRGAGGGDRRRARGREGARRLRARAGLARPTLDGWRHGGSVARARRARPAARAWACASTTR